MEYKIVVESKAWNKADIIEGRINIFWEKEIDFDILEYQLHSDSGEIVFRSESEEDIIKWLTAQDSTHSTSKTN